MVRLRICLLVGALIAAPMGSSASSEPMDRQVSADLGATAIVDFDYARDTDTRASISIDNVVRFENVRGPHSATRSLRVALPYETYTDRRTPLSHRSVAFLRDGRLVAGVFNAVKLIDAERLSVTSVRGHDLGYATALAQAPGLETVVGAFLRQRRQAADVFGLDQVPVVREGMNIAIAGANQLGLGVGAFTHQSNLAVIQRGLDGSWSEVEVISPLLVRAARQAGWPSEQWLVRALIPLAGAGNPSVLVVCDCGLFVMSFERGAWRIEALDRPVAPRGSSIEVVEAAVAPDGKLVAVAYAERDRLSEATSFRVRFYDETLAPLSLVLGSAQLGAGPVTALALSSGGGGAYVVHVGDNSAEIRSFGVSPAARTVGEVRRRVSPARGMARLRMYDDLLFAAADDGGQFVFNGANEVVSRVARRAPDFSMARQICGHTLDRRFEVAPDGATLRFNLAPAGPLYEAALTAGSGPQIREVEQARAIAGWRRLGEGACIVRDKGRRAAVRIGQTQRDVVLREGNELTTVAQFPNDPLLWVVGSLRGLAVYRGSWLRATVNTVARVERVGVSANEALIITAESDGALRWYGFHNDELTLLVSVVFEPQSERDGSNLAAIAFTSSGQYALNGEALRFARVVEARGDQIEERLIGDWGEAARPDLLISSLANAAPLRPMSNSPIEIELTTAWCGQSNCESLTDDPDVAFDVRTRGLRGGELRADIMVNYGGTYPASCDASGRCRAHIRTPEVTRRSDRPARTRFYVRACYEGECAQPEVMSYSWRGAADDGVGRLRMFLVGSSVYAGAQNPRDLRFTDDDVIEIARLGMAALTSDGETAQFSGLDATIVLDPGYRENPALAQQVEQQLSAACPLHDACSFEVLTGPVDLADQLERFARASADQGRSDDLVVFFYAGHGYQEANAPILQYTSTAILPVREAMFTIGRMRGMKLIVLNACRNEISPDSTGSDRGEAPGAWEARRIFTETLGMEGWVAVVPRSSARTFELEGLSSDAPGNGMLSRSVVDGLSGRVYSRSWAPVPGAIPFNCDDAAARNCLRSRVDRAARFIGLCTEGATSELHQLRVISDHFEGDFVLTMPNRAEPEPPQTTPIVQCLRERVSAEFIEPGG